MTRPASKRTGVLVAVAVAVLALGIAAFFVATSVLSEAERPMPSCGTQSGPECGAKGARTPGQLLSLSSWYLMLPTGSQGHPDSIEQPELATYSSEWFHLDAAGTGVVFTAYAGGATTKGSSFPRTELREMTPNGDKASWAATSGTHSLAVRQAVTALPPGRPAVVTAQILDGDDDALQVRLEGSRLFVRTGDKEAVLDADYVLGHQYDLVITVANGHVVVGYNGVRKLDAPLEGSNCYFKTGSYEQTNPSKGDAPDAVATTVLYALSLHHDN